MILNFASILPCPSAAIQGQVLFVALERVNAGYLMGVANRALEKIYKRKRDFARLVS